VGRAGLGEGCLGGYLGWGGEGGQEEWVEGGR